jgi:NAD(P)-dependent dehydrogenase (short-subunit alcohol dehydrogenase family)
VFFNNAYSWNGYGHCQTELLYKVWRQWRTKNKRIVCMSSIGGDIHKEVDEIEPWEEGKGYLGYDSHKAGLDHACKQLNTLPYWKLGYHCKIINVRPGYVDTQLALDSHPTLDPNSNTLKGVQHASNFTIKKIDPNRIAEIVLWTIQHQEHIMSITIGDQQVAI